VDDVQVKFSANIASLQQGAAGAAQAVNQATQQMTGGFSASGDAAVGFGGKLSTALNVGLFLEFQAVATEALHLVKEAFESTVGAAEEFELSTAKFAALLGIGQEEAAGLSAALTAVGSSSDEYSSMALRMEMRLRTQESALKSLGMATRDHNGELLSGKALMDSAIRTMETYKAGTDQNEFALRAFGRGARQVYDIMRVTDESVVQYSRDLESLGIEVGPDATRAAAELEEELARVKQNFEYAGIAAGQTFYNAFVAATGEVDSSTEIYQYFEQAVLNLGQAFFLLITYGRELYAVLELIAREDVDIAMMWYNLGKLDFTAARESLNNMASDSANYSNTIRELTAEDERFNAVIDEQVDKLHNNTVAFDDDIDAAERYAEKMGSLEGFDPAKQASGIYASGAKSFVPPPSNKAAEEARKIADEKLQIAMQEALGELKVTEDKNAFLYSMGQKSLDEFIAQAKDLEEKKYAIQSEYITRKEAIDKGKLSEELKDQGQAKALYEAHILAMQQLNEKYATEKRTQDNDNLQEFVHTQDAELNAAVSHLDREVQHHQISALERDAIEKDLTQKTYSEEIKRYDDLLVTLVGQNKLWQKAYDERQAIVEKSNAAIAKNEDKLSQDIAQAWFAENHAVLTAEDQFVQGMFAGQQTLNQMLLSALATFLEQELAADLKYWTARELAALEGTSAEAIAEKGGILTHLLGETQKTAATTAGTTARVSTQAAGASAGSAIDKAAGSTSIVNDAYKAAAGTYAALADIPYIGPVIAPIAAAGAFTAVMAFDTLTSFDVGSWNVPHDMPAMVHAGELIVPAGPAEDIRRGTPSGATFDSLGKQGGYNGPSELHYNMTVHAVDGASVVSMASEHAKVFADAVFGFWRDNPTSQPVY
jgi:hypothetical protein